MQGDGDTDLPNNFSVAARGGRVEESKSDHDLSLQALSKYQQQQHDTQAV
jgi:hypothetical protein